MKGWLTEVRMGETNYAAIGLNHDTWTVRVKVHETGGGVATHDLDLAGAERLYEEFTRALNALRRWEKQRRLAAVRRKARGPGGGT